MTTHDPDERPRESASPWHEHGSAREGEGVPAARLGLDRMPRMPDVPAVPPPQRGNGVRSRVRPYARTGGRTGPARDLALEALVSTNGDGSAWAESAAGEHRLIGELCIQTRSVAEIAAHLGLPLAVVKVFVGDMAEAGLVRVHEPGLLVADRSSHEFMERVLDGLRAL